MSLVHVVVLTYIQPIEAIEPHMSGHIAWLEKGYADGLFLSSGRKVPRTGGVILAQGDLDALAIYLDQDPFNQHALATHEIITFDATKSISALSSLV